MMSRLVFLLFCGNIALLLGNAQKLPRVKRQSLKVQINVTSDGVCMRYIRPSTSTKLEGFILGYGSSFFSNQYISLPADGKSYMTEVDAEPRYLISVRPMPVANYKKSCSGKTHTPKPLQLVIGTLTPTSVFLSWGILVNPKHDWTTMNNCANDRFYTVRYREKDKNKKWALQLCPTTETVVDNLKPNAVYEFGVKDNTDNGIWSKIFNHKVVMPSKNKENGQPQNNYILHNIQTQFIPGNSKVLHPVTIIKQVLQNVTQRTKPKIPEKSPLAGPILVHLIVPDFNGTQQKLLSPFTLDVPEKPKKTPAKNETQEWPAESKTPEVQEISPQSQPAMAELDWESSKPTTPSVLKESESPSARTNSELEASKHSVTPMAELSPDILAPYKFPEFPKTKTPPTSPMSTETLASHEIESVSSESQTPVPKATRTKQVFSKTQPALSRPRTSDETDIPDSKRAVTNEPTLESLTPKTAKPLDWPKSTLAPPEIAFIPSKWKPSDTPEGTQVKPAPNLPPLKHSTPKTSRILEKTTATPGAPVETNVIPSIPKPSIRPKTPDIKSAEKEHQWETTTHKTFKPVEFPRTTKVPSKTKIPVSMSQILPHLEQPKIVPAVTRTLIPVPATTMVSGAFELPVTTIASYESDSIPFKPKEPDYIIPEVQDSKPGSYESSSIPSKPEGPANIMPDIQDSKPDSYELTSIPSKPKKPDYTMPEVQDNKPASYESSFIPSKPKETDYIKPEVQDSKPASYESSSIPSKPKERDYIMPDIPDRKPASYESSSIPSKPKETDYIKPEVQDSKFASYESTIIPSKPKEHDYIIPDIQDSKPASYESSSIPPKAKERDYIMPDIQERKPASSESSSIPSKPKEHDYIMPDIQDRKPASYEQSSIPSKPKEPDYIMPEIQDSKPVSYESSSIPSKPKEPDYIMPEVQDSKPAFYESSSVLSEHKEPDHTMPELQDSKPASYESTSIPSKRKKTNYTKPEVQDSKPASYETSYIPSKPKETEYIVADVQDSKPASSESNSIPSKLKESDYIVQELQDSKHDSAEADNFSFKVPTTTELPFIDSVMEPVTFSNELPIVAPKVKEHAYSPKTTITPHLLHTKPVLEPIVLETDPPKTEIEERPPLSTRPKNWFITDAPQTTPDMEPVTFRIEQPKSTLAPKETSQVPARLKTSPSPSIMRTKPSPKGNRRVSSKPKVPPTKSSLKVPPTKSEITSFSPDPITIMVPHVPEKAKATLASTVEQFIPNKSKPSTKPRMVETKPAVHRTTSQPFVLKPTVSSEQIKTIMAPKETWFISSKPKTSGKLDGPPSKPVPDAIYPTFPGSINLHIHVFNGPKDSLAVHKVHDTTAKPKTTDKTRSRLVVNKTTPVPGRTRTPGGVAWNKLSRGDKLTDQDATKLLSTSSSIRSNSSIHSSVSRKKPDPVATPPDLPRPPLAPAKPTPVRRKPLPPNTVTGKPGRSGNILMPRAPPPSTPTSLIKPAGPTGHAKTSSHKKPPTAASSPDYSNPMFSSLPTTETDVAGTPRYTGDHVKYMKKEEDVPCSITDTLQHFPTEDGENIDTATTPPRKPPTNLTVVTVEGCPSFVILDWEKPQNETVTEYKVVSTENGSSDVRDTSIITTNQTHSTVENLKPNTSYAFQVIPSNPLGEGPSSESMPFKTESADPRVTEPISMGKDAIWTEIKFNSDTYSECKGKQYVKRTWYKKFVGVQLCNSLRYKIYLSDTLTGTFYNIGDQRGHGEDHCQFVDSYLDGRTGQQIPSDQLSTKDGFFRAVRQEPVHFGRIGAETHTNYVHWYECGTTIPGKW
ncbi:target of Nesh-SH3 isoform X4 [Anolis sagrei]|uniref:target of Nesh-SH3 isoform X4 n=1 Tax=Anolis sagrei TaxID=38937 RepID=UPI0035218413